MRTETGDTAAFGARGEKRPWHGAGGRNPLVMEIAEGRRPDRATRQADVPFKWRDDGRAIFADDLAIRCVSPPLDGQTVQAREIAFVGFQFGGDCPRIVEVAVEDRDPPIGEHRGAPHVIERLAQGQVTLSRKGRERNLSVRVTTEQSADAEHGYVVTIDDITELVTAQRTSAWADVARRIAGATDETTLRVHPEPEGERSVLVKIPYARIRQHRQYAAPNQDGFLVTLSPAADPVSTGR